MGLDVLALSKVEFAGKEEPADAEERWYLEIRADDDFRGHHDDYPEGFYRPACGCETHSFRAGSYHGFNRWRNQLAEFALGEPCRDLGDFLALVERSEEFAGRPFHDLIFFSDCDGVIAQRVSIVLANDFASHQSRAEEWEKDHKGFLEKYKDFWKAFDLAAQGGAVIFT